MATTPPGPQEMAGQESTGLDATPQQVPSRVEGSSIVPGPSRAGSAQAETASVRLLATRQLRAQEARLRLSAAGWVNAGRCALQTSAAGGLYCQDARAKNSTFGAAVANAATLSRCQALLVAGRYVSLADSRPLFLVAGSTDGQVRPMLDLRSAAALGATLGLVLGAATLLRAILQR